MLKEPEVLNMVEQYRDVFEALFIPYASITIGSQSFMELPDFLQFSQEFHIVPSLASRHEVLRAYLAAECLEPVYACEDELKDEPEMDEIEQQIPRSSRSAAPRTSTSSATRKSRFAAAARHTIAAMTSETGLSALKITKRSNSIPAATKVENSPAAQVLSSLSRRPSKATARNPSVRAFSDGSSSPEGSETSKKSRLPQVPQVKPVTVCFGLGAFVETLCRVVFMYLLVNGNASQLAMTSQARMGWLIAYLRAILLLNRDQSKGQQPKQQEQLQQQEEQQQQQPLQDNNRAQLTGLAQESSETVNPAAEQTTTTIPTTTTTATTTTTTATTTTPTPTPTRSS